MRVTALDAIASSMSAAQATLLEARGFVVALAYRSARAIEPGRRVVSCRRSAQRTAPQFTRTSVAGCDEVGDRRGFWRN